MKQLAAQILDVYGRKSHARLKCARYKPQKPYAMHRTSAHGMVLFVGLTRPSNVQKGGCYKKKKSLTQEDTLLSQN